MSKKSFARIIRIVTGTFGTAKDEIFSLESNLTRFEKFVHFWVLVTRSFIRNRCPIRASALSFTTLLALIPMIAVAMSVSSAFLKTQGEQQLKTFISQFIEHLVPNELSAASEPETIGDGGEASTNVVAAIESGETNVVAEIASTNSVAAVTSPGDRKGDGRIAKAKKQAAETIYEFIQNTSSGSLGVFGVIFLLWTTIATLTRVEETFNDIWGVTRGRDWLSRITNYFTATVLMPILSILALGLASGPHFQKTRDLLNVVPYLEPVVSQLLPLLIIGVAFALFYKLVPNTKVHLSAALVGGGLAALSWHLFNLASLHLASRAVSASKIYGSLFLVPLLMFGLYVVWVIILFGAQVAYAFQNRESYLQERIAENVNQRGREFVALRLMTCIGQHFHTGQPPATVTEMSRELGIPSKLVQQVLQTLLAARLVIEVSGIEPAYSPARPLETINGHHILLAMRATQGQELVTRDEPVRLEVYGEFARIQAAEKEAASSVTMLALVTRAQARMELAPPTEPENNLIAATKVVEVTELPHEPATATAPEIPTEPEPSQPAPPAPQIVALPKAETHNDEDRSFPL